MKYILLIIILLTIHLSASGQTQDATCSHDATIERHLLLNPNAERELLNTEKEMQKLIRQLNLSDNRSENSYVIPVVMHVFHFGEDGKMGMEQALAGLEILNEDFNGFNDGWETIDSEFDSIKGTIDITFCLATIDPEGNPTTGIIYHEDEEALLNKGDLFQHAWDNYKYLNIYFPKYTQGSPSDFTAYAYYPSTNNANNNRDGIFYSSIRWGYGEHSELDEGDDWASVCTHEAGHWLNLRHTFNGGCSSAGDFVDDTPATTGGTIELEGCYNNDFSCNVRTNGENYMDYNHRCKKMFTQGQVQRMEAALLLPSRVKLWSEGNLIETGCLGVFSSVQNITKNIVAVYPNPASENITFISKHNKYKLFIYNGKGQLCLNKFVDSSKIQIDLSTYPNGIYFYNIYTAGKASNGKFIID